MLWPQLCVWWLLHSDISRSSQPDGPAWMFGDGMIPLPHIYGARIKGVEVFCPLDPPPPYEAVASNPAAQAQNTEVQMTDLTEVLTESAEAETPSDDRCHQTAILSPTPPAQSRQPHSEVSSSRKPHRPRHRRSNSDPVLLDLTAKGRGGILKWSVMSSAEI
uniref:Family with sequence similarity 189 member A2 n=1 Tax=Cyprinus carpio TaxID=7962 RepID=A0A8C2I7E2_CYPCA